MPEATGKRPGIRRVSSAPRLVAGAAGPAV